MVPTTTATTDATAPTTTEDTTTDATDATVTQRSLLMPIRNELIQEFIPINSLPSVTNDFSSGNLSKSYHSYYTSQKIIISSSHQCR